MKTLQALSAKPEPAADGQKDVQTPPPKPEQQRVEMPNPMVSVLERHERISNRVRSSSPKK